MKILEKKLSVFPTNKKEQGIPNILECNENLKLPDLRHVDSFLEIQNLEKNSIDCILTDPPYFLDNFDRKWNIPKIKEKQSKAVVVQSLPVGMKFDPKQGPRLSKFIQKISLELFRVAKPGTFYLCFSQPRLTHQVSLGIESAGFEIRDILAWKRESQAKAFSLLHFIKKMKIPPKEKQKLTEEMKDLKTPQLKGQYESIVLAQKPKEGTFIQNYQKWRTGLIYTNNGLGRFPGNILECPRPSKEERQFGHITVKPIQLIRELLQIFTQKNHRVLDPFLGSGTTAVACFLEERKCLGFEIQKEYFKICNEKLDYYARSKTSQNSSD